MAGNSRRSPRLKRKPAPQREKNGSRTLTPVDPTRPVGNKNPPREFQFKPGNKAAVGHKGPRTLAQLREHIQRMGDEPVTAELTRLDLLLRSMYASKSAGDKENVLKYGYGVVVQPTQARTYEDDIIDLLIAGTVAEEQVTLELPDDAPRLIATARLRRNEGGAVEAEKPSAD